MARVDVDELRDKVKVMYRAVADAPGGEQLGGEQPLLDLADQFAGAFAGLQVRAA